MNYTGPNLRSRMERGERNARETRRAATAKSYLDSVVGFTFCTVS